ncbi:MAG: hypothetical protein V3U43_10235 [Pseudomonadales bacterium]
MADEEKTAKKEALLGLLDEVDKDGKAIQDTTRTLINETTFSLDVAACVREFVQTVRNDSALAPRDWNHMQSAWEGWRASAAGVRDALAGGLPFTLSAQATGVSTSTVLTEYSSRSWDPARFLSNINPIVIKLGSVLARQPRRGAVLDDLVRLGLDKRLGSSRSAAELLEEACHALDQPSTEPASPVAVLLSLRESIQAAIVDLLPKRPSQEPAKNWQDKVISIGRQCGWRDLSPGHFERLGTDVESLMDSLSGAKRETCARQELIRRFDGGLLYLRSFLGSIDETRFRTSKGGGQG